MSKNTKNIASVAILAASATAGLFSEVELKSDSKPGKPTKAAGKKASEKPAVVVDTTKKNGAEAAPEEEPKAPKPTKLKFERQVLKLSDLVFSNKIQAREKLNKEAVDDYTDLAKAALDKGADSPLPALKVVQRNGENLVISGFTRGAALKKAGYTETAVDVAKNDSITDSELFAIAIRENLEHGARLTGQDKLHNLLRIVRFPEYSNLSNNALVPIVGASEFFIRKHRPVSASKSTSRVSKKGHAIKTSRIGKKGGPSAKAVDAANANAESNELDPDAKKSAPAGKPAPSQDDALSRAIVRVTTLLDGYLGFKSSEVRKAIEDGTIKVSASDMRAWAETSDARVKQIAPLVINLGWSPRKAFSHIDQEIKTTTKVEHLINSAITTGGYTRAMNAIGEKVADNETYRALVWDTSKFEVKVTPIAGK